MNTTENPQESQKVKASFDPLLECLVVISKLYNKSCSSQTIISKLPFSHHRLTPALFSRAAQQVDLVAEVIQQPMRGFYKLKLPVILLLQEDHACVLTELSPDGTAKIIFPEKAEREKSISMAELMKIYLGKTIVIFPKYSYDSRTNDPGKPKEKRWFWDVIVKVWRGSGDILMASFLINVFAMVYSLFTMTIYNRVVPNSATSTLWILASGIFVIYIFDFIMRNLRAYFIDSSARGIDVELSRDIYSHLLDIQMNARPNSMGGMVNTIQTFEAFRDFVTSSTISVLIDIPFVVLFLITIAILGGWIVFVPIIAIPFLLILGLFVQGPLNDLVRQSHRMAAEKDAVLIETLSGMETIKGMHVEKRIQNRWDTIITASAKINVKLQTLATMGINFSTFAQQFATIILVFAGVLLIENGDMTIGALIAASILTTRTLIPISQLAGLLARYQQCKAAINSLDKVMQLPTERPREKSFLYLSKLSGDIEFKNVHFVYPGQFIPAIENLSFHIRAKEKVGIIGAIGSGKSTTVKLIMKFYEPSAGNLLIDHYEEHQLDPAEIRHFIGYVPQDVMLFQGTIKENIIYGAPPVDDSAIIRAARLATLDLFVGQHPDAFNRQVGEMGRNLSAGQRQAVIIARALLLNPSILVVDELTSALDDKTTSILIERLRPVLVNKTLILVTHRASMLNLVDRLIVMDAGHVVADGPRDEIIHKLTEEKIQSYAPPPTVE